jgi:PhnB protein
MSNVKPIPTDSSIVIPMLVCHNVSSEIEFCKAVFEAVEVQRRPGPDGTVAHALLKISDETIIIEAKWPTLASFPPIRDGSSPVVIFVYVEDVDTPIAGAVDAGADILLPLTNQFWGDRTARIMDPEGHVWTVASRIETTSSPERDERWANIVKTKT